ncbi:MAG: hypothetical protein KatS3mg083_104 [Candidatus Dojkabacteria bacterium]|nr:MAG: hypothetical protein KatS3mg083_104 [Candidatus Dojkabacteria bacterium]
MKEEKEIVEQEEGYDEHEEEIEEVEEIDEEENDTVDYENEAITEEENEVDYEELPEDELLVIRYKQDDGNEVTEQIKYGDLPNVIKAFKNLLEEREQIKAYAQQLNTYRSILDLVSTDPVVNKIVEARIKNLPLDEVMEEIKEEFRYTKHESENEPEDEIEQKIKALESLVISQQKEKIRQNNYQKLVNILNERYQYNEEDIPILVNTAQQVAVELIKEIYPNAELEGFFDNYDVPQKFVDTLWREVAERVPDKITYKKQSQQDTNRSMVARKKPPSQIPADAGASITRRNEEGRNYIARTPAERKQLLDRFIYGK